MDTDRHEQLHEPHGAVRCPRCGSEAPPRWFPFVVGYEHKGSRGGQALWGIGREVEDVVLGLCADCHLPTLWHAGSPVWPARTSAPPAAPGMPPAALAGFEEARRVFDSSPRSSAALLRLSLRELLEHAGLPDPAASDEARASARWTLPAGVWQSLRDVRAAGDDAVPPGRLDPRDDRESALALFDLVNVLVVRLIVEPAAWKPPVSDEPGAE